MRVKIEVCVEEDEERELQASVLRHQAIVPSLSRKTNGLHMLTYPTLILTIFTS